MILELELIVRHINRHIDGHIAMYNLVISKLQEFLRIIIFLIIIDDIKDNIISYQ